MSESNLARQLVADTDEETLTVLLERPSLTLFHGAPSLLSWKPRVSRFESRQIVVDNGQFRPFRIY